MGSKLVRGACQNQQIPSIPILSSAHLPLKQMCTENTNLEKDSRQCDGELGIAARSAVRSAREEGNVRLVVSSIDVLAVPATGEIDLRTDAARARRGWELVVPDGLAVEVQAKESNRLLGIGRGVISTEGGVATNHAELPTRACKQGC